MRKLIKLSIIALAILATLSSSIYFVIATESDLHLMSEDKIITEIKTKNPFDVINISMTPVTKSILLDCKYDTSCIVPVLWNLAKTESQDVILKSFSEISNSKGHLVGSCHSFGHDLGSFLYSYTGNLNQAILLVDMTCGGSLYHGILQEHFRTKPQLDYGDSTFVEERNICNKLSDVSYSQMRLECIHAIGHGLHIANDFDFFVTVKKCEEFEDELDQRECIEGASMENAQAFSRGKGTFDENDILFPCSVLDDRYAGDCYTFHSIYILKKVNGSAEDAFIQCDKAQKENHIRHCYYGIGMKQPLDFQNKSEMLVNQCEKGNINYQTYCFAGALYIAADEIGMNKGFELCNNIPSKFKMKCYESLGRWIQATHFTKEEIENACSSNGNSKYYQACIKANPEDRGPL